MQCLLLWLFAGFPRVLIILLFVYVRICHCWNDAWKHDIKIKKFIQIQFIFLRLSKVDPTTCPVFSALCFRRKWSCGSLLQLNVLQSNENQTYSLTCKGLDCRWRNFFIPTQNCQRRYISRHITRSHLRKHLKQVSQKFAIILCLDINVFSMALWLT